MLCGARSYAAIGQWAQDQDITLMHRLGFTRRPPKAGGIRKVLIALNAKAFEHALTQWVGTLLSRPITARPSLPEAYALVSLAISNARNSRAAAMLEVKSSFSKELGPCVAENRVRSRSLLTINRSFSRSLTARSGLGIKSSAPAFSWGLRTEPGPKTWPS